jgi:hypothetical protein
MIIGLQILLTVVVYLLLIFFTHRCDSMKEFRFQKLIMLFAGIVIINSTFAGMIIYGIEDTTVAVCLLIALTAIAFFCLWVVGKRILKADPMRRHPKHFPYIAKELNFDEQNAWRGEINTWLEENFGAWVRSMSKIHIDSGVAVIAFPYNAQSPSTRYDNSPGFQVIDTLHWRVCLGIYVYNIEKMRLFPSISRLDKVRDYDNFPAQTTTNISIIRDLRIHDRKHVKTYFDLLKRKIPDYLVK